MSFERGYQIIDLFQKYGHRLCKTMCKGRWMGPILKMGGTGWVGSAHSKVSKGYPLFIFLTTQ